MKIFLTPKQANKWYIKIWRVPILKIKYCIIKLLYKMKGI